MPNAVPLASVVIPAYNRPEFLKECLESVAAQTHRNVEVFVVDDASKEEIAPVVESVEWPSHIAAHYIRLDENRGPGNAREIGRLRAQGKYIAYLDSDDIWLPEFLEAHVSHLEAHPDVGVSFSGFEIMGSEPHISVHADLIDGSAIRPLSEMFWGENWILPSQCVWTKRCTDVIGPWVIAGDSEDTNYILRAGFLETKVIHIARVLARYRAAHGQDQLSQTQGRTIRVKRTIAFLHAGDELLASDKVHNPHYASPIAHILFDSAVILLLMDETDYSRRCLSMANSLASMTTYVGFAARLTTVASRLSPPSIAGRVGRRLNIHLVKPRSEWHQRQ